MQSLSGEKRKNLSSLKGSIMKLKNIFAALASTPKSEDGEFKLQRLLDHHALYIKQIPKVSVGPANFNQLSARVGRRYAVPRRRRLAVLLAVEVPGGEAEPGAVHPQTPERDQQAARHDIRGRGGRGVPRGLAQGHVRPGGKRARALTRRWTSCCSAKSTASTCSCCSTTTRVTSKRTSSTSDSRLTTLSLPHQRHHRHCLPQVVHRPRRLLPERALRRPRHRPPGPL